MGLKDPIARRAYNRKRWLVTHPNAPERFPHKYYGTKTHCSWLVYPI